MHSRLSYLMVIATLSFTSEVAPTQERTSGCSSRFKDNKLVVECIQGSLGALPDSLDPETQVLDISHNALQRLPPRAFADNNLLHLQKLLMSGCGLRQVDPLAFFQLTNLVALDLSRNNLSVVPDAALKYTIALRDLNLSGNKIRYIPAELPSELVKLDLSHCRITSIHDRAFLKLKKLQELRLDSNRLTHFKTSLVMSLHGLHGVELQNNPFYCDCQLRALYIWLSNVSHPTSPTCYKPDRLSGKRFRSLELRSFACPPQVLLSGEKAQGRAGSNITAWCPVAGLPTPTVSWFFGDTPIHNTSKVGAATVYIMNEVSEEKGSLLVLSGAAVKDSGATLRCVATNEAGADAASFILKIDSAPSILPLTYDQIIGLSCAIIFGTLIAGCVILVVIRRRRRPKNKVNGNLVLTFPNGGGSVVAARTPDDNRDDYESDGQEEQDDYTMTRLASSRANSLVTTLIDTGGDENEELIHRTPQRPLTGVWPAQALALLDSAAPEHVMYSTTGRGPRHSLLPDFAPDYTNSWACHFSTLPRTQRQDTSQFQQRSYTPDEAPLCPPNFMNNITIPAPCPPPPPLSPSVCSVPSLLAPEPCATAPPPAMATLHTKLSRITARDSPDEGYQEGTDV